LYDNASGPGPRLMTASTLAGDRIVNRSGDTLGDVSEIIAQRGAEIEHCYIDALGAARRGGRLDLMFVIARDGHVVSLDSAAPGVPVVAAHHLHECLRTAVEALQFPARRNDTTAVVPYYFQRTDAPNAGPQLSCWNPRGCKSDH